CGGRTGGPRTREYPNPAAAWTAVLCWGRRPDFSRLARIFSMRNGRPVKSESVRAVRRIWPPPSPREPSSRTTSRPPRGLFEPDPDPITRSSARRACHGRTHRRGLAIAPAPPPWAASALQLSDPVLDSAPATRSRSHSNRSRLGSPSMDMAPTILVRIAGRPPSLVAGSGTTPVGRGSPDLTLRRTECLHMIERITPAWRSCAGTPPDPPFARGGPAGLFPPLRGGGRGGAAPPNGAGRR